MTITTANISSLTVTPDVEVANQLVGVHILFTIAGDSGQPLTMSGQFEDCKPMNFGRGVIGVGGMFATDGPHRIGSTGRTAMFIPAGTIVLVR